MSGRGIALAALLVAAAGPAGFFAYRFLAAEHLVGAPGASAGAALSVAPRGTPATESPAAPAAGNGSASAAASPASLELPDITLPDAAGAPRKLSSWRGKPLIVNFWATWCEPCRREIPLLESLRRKATDHLEVVGIAVDERDPVLQYMKRMGIDYPVLVGGQDQGTAAIEAFGMQDAVLPFSVFADVQGRIVAAKVGELHPDDAALILGRLADVDSGRMPVEKAREEISSGLAALAAARSRAQLPAAAGQ